MSVYIFKCLLHCCTVISVAQPVRTLFIELSLNIRIFIDIFIRDIF